MKEKFFLFSKTIIGVLIAAFAFFLGDQVGMPEDVKKWLVAFGLGLAGFGRFVADKKLTFKLGGDNEAPPGPGLTPHP